MILYLHSQNSTRLYSDMTRSLMDSIRNCLPWLNFAQGKSLLHHSIKSVVTSPKLCHCHPKSWKNICLVPHLKSQGICLNFCWFVILALLAIDNVFCLYFGHSFRFGKLSKTQIRNKSIFSIFLSSSHEPFKCKWL